MHESERSVEPRLGQDVVVRIIDVKDDGSMNGSLYQENMSVFQMMRNKY